ncbi:phosphinothricin N-acetyltransferase YncA [Flavobacterium cauense R2A-7]|uniref:Phosphinothricin acetyltransferase n=1 Tax=Flavobacterium cauense R2A-7 TaxID=1341154 RepID=V6S4E7_9FLAO|nr:GNAT family N-acetyltransferase [Flavobacterium cauense]ESU21289.1 phosphinothricin N-acetyltransferase YncA [Flavobacterium cauense R2A-7]KGO80061.1 phosphinothricin acetyltransferase [Flavobacterium cauense R2A-7]TWI09000.1 phosphinothricin acetyltransferase [Flavobacterium cauense R2A-7]
MSIIIRQATVEDMPSVLEIVNHEILHSTSIYDYEPRTLALQNALFHEKTERNFPFIVAEKNGVIVGFGTYGPFRFKEAYKFTVEHSVYVHKDYTGNGIGSTLLKELIELAKLNQLHTMIGVIDSENKGSISFHERMGFKVSGHLKETGFKFGRWLDSVFVQLILK